MALENAGLLLHRPGGWLPTDRVKLNAWMRALIEKVRETGVFDAKEIVFQHQSVTNLYLLIENNQDIFVLANMMIAQALAYDSEDPEGNPEVTTYQMMLHLIDYLISTAPEYMQKDAQGRGLIGFPINAVLDWSMGTTAGFAFFLNTKVNLCLKDILQEWCEYLTSTDSLSVLNTSDSGWMCAQAADEINIDEFQYNPNDLHWGFKSWNDFFTRVFKEGARPLPEDDSPNIIVSACESEVYGFCDDIKENQEFWIKEQPYSIEYMLQKDTWSDMFIGGTLYQAFLSATKYHRWNSPVSGTIKDAYIIPGTYYSEVHSKVYDPAGPNNSQAYITHVATRAVIIIESDNPKIGVMGFVAVGMAEVSSCVIGVQVGQHIEKGEEIGYFQFGGSTHCLIFQKGVINEFFYKVQDDVKVKAKLASVNQ